jgi:D-apionolactonase
MWREVRAGPVVAQFDGFDLRRIMLAEVELVRRVSVAVRDPAWGTVPVEASRANLAICDDGFAVESLVRHRAVDIDFSWRGEIRGAPTGIIEWELDGVAATDFFYNRIGLTVMHPVRESAGSSYVARRGSAFVSGRLPTAIGPQRIRGGVPQPLLPAFTRLELEPSPRLWVRFEYEGDLFEMEDQRNWTDASFKTYSTPLAQGFPHRAVTGQRIVQRLRVSLLGDVAKGTRRRPRPTEIAIGAPQQNLLPAIGTAQPDHGGTPSEPEATLLRAAGLAHLRADLVLASDTWRAALRDAIDTSRAIGADLTLTLFAGHAEDDLDALPRELAAAGAEVSMVLAFDRENSTTSRGLVTRVRQVMQASGATKIAGGTASHFVELNRRPLDLGTCDAIAYSITPQVHAFDDASLVETLEMQAETVRTARKLFPAVPVVIGSVALKLHRAAADAGAASCLREELDERQGTLFGAAWTAGSIKYLAEGGASAVTYFRLSGPSGLVNPHAPDAAATVGGSRSVAAVKATPVYHVLRDVAGWRGADVLDAISDAPLCVGALAVRHQRGVGLLVFNLCATRQRCVIRGLPDGDSWVRALDSSSTSHATSDSEGFRCSGESRSVLGGTLSLELDGYAVARVDILAC